MRRLFRFILLLWLLICCALAVALLPARWFYPPLTGTLALVSDRDGSNDIFLLDLETRRLTNLTQTPEVNEIEPEWSPDGTQLVYVVYPVEGNTLRSYPCAQNGDLYVMSVDGTQPRSLGIQGTAPHWTPDGRRIVYASCWIAWPNSRGLDYLLGQLYAYDVQTGNTSPESPQPTLGRSNALSNRVWSRSGLFVVQQYNYEHIAWAMRLDGTPVLQQQRMLYSCDPALSPDGRLLALYTILLKQRDDLSSYYTEGRISIVDSSGRWIFPVSEPMFGGSPTWSPTGHYLAYDAIGGNGKWGIEFVRVNGAGWQPLTPFDGFNYFAPSWRP